ncbi:MAG TPA: glutamine--tRNA ligase/YqeY domain fusion protein [Spirochaetia bacterium]|nr:glutamine--tRNA ligase/YqeY domain fusion protein [Spirochaetia bacterium]
MTDPLSSPPGGAASPSDFIREAVKQDLASGRFTYVRTRWPPEPNGYLHIGHAKAICLDFGIASEFGGNCNFRFDDTNPEKEEQEYVDAITADVRWLGFQWGGREFFASDYFEQLYQWAVQLITAGKAYVCDLNDQQIREYRGTDVADKGPITVTPPGRNSPYRDRSVEENLDLFRRMRAGEFPDGARTLRAKIDMAHPNLHMRDPVMYRIRHATHHRSGDAWCIYPMYDFQHPLSDSIEGVTHSLCSQEYEIHRPLYDWFLENLGIFHSRQIEFARLNLSHTVMSKRWLLELVRDGRVSGWDDPRMPTLAGLRRRGYTPAAIRDFVGRVGISKTESVVDIALLEHCVREDLNRTAPRVMAVLKPVKLVIENWPAGRVEQIEAVNNPEDPAAGTRRVPFSGELFIEQDDVREVPPPKYYRLFPGNQVRLRYAYVVTCTSVRKDPATGAITEVRCTYDPETRGGNAPDNRKVKATIHWVSAPESLIVEARLYDHLFSSETPQAVPDGVDWKDTINPSSLEVIRNARAEPGLADRPPGSRVQFERLGYFVVDSDSAPGALVLNRIVSLKDAWARLEKKATAGVSPA